MYTLSVNKINNCVEILKGVVINYSIEATPKNFNNNGKWGKIENAGEVVKSMLYNPSRWKGEGSFPEVMSEMKAEFSNINNLPVS